MHICRWCFTSSMLAGMKIFFFKEDVKFEFERPQPNTRKVENQQIIEKYHRAGREGVDG
jgi:hypothetical protein